MKLIQLAFLTLFIFVGCTQEEVENIEILAPDYTKAVAVIHPIGDSGVTGTVRFESVSEGVSVNAEINGLEEGNKGFHIHQFGNCTASDGTSAGGHFNPTENKHSSPEAMDRHMGDMGNIIANESGNATKNYIDSSIRIDQIIGRGVIVHAGEDDLTSQPSGAAGSRIACGVIGVAE